jgi:long-chain acyl-CoA synthetase
MPLFEKLGSFEQNTAFILPNNEEKSYADLLSDVYDFEHFLKGGELLLIVSKISYEVIFGYIAGLRKKTAVMFVDHKTNLSDVNNIIELYRPDFVFAPNEWFEGHPFLTEKNCLKFGHYTLKFQAEVNKRDINPQLAVLLGTSGSLGVKKYVRLSHNNLESNTKAIIEYLRITEDDRAITTMPIGYSYMLSIINTHLDVGASIVICQNSIIEKEFWQKARSRRITSLSGVPIFFEMLIRLGLEKISVPSLRQITQAGGKLSHALTKQMIEFSQSQNIEFISMYGQTEAAPRISYLDWASAKHKIGSIGKAIPNVKMWLETPNGETISSYDEHGEIVASGENICLGYSDSAQDLKRGNDNKGVIRTGDLAYQDSEGYFFISGRLKRFAKIDGHRLNLDDIEQKMKAINIEVACIEGDNKIKAFFDHTVEADHMIDLLHLNTGQKKTTFICIQLNKLPLTSNGKIDYKSLTEVSNA